MRTMLISLIVIYSLALVARAADPEIVDSGGCGTIYKCYAPESCTVTAQHGKTLDQDKPVEVTGPIFKDCPAITLFYQYNQSRVHVSIESLLDTSEVASIELLQTRFGNVGTQTKFSCLNNNGKMEGKVEDTPAEPNVPPVIRIPKNVTVRCDPADFEFDIDDMHDKAKKYSEISYRAGKGSTIMIRCAIEIKFLCDYDVKEHPDPEHTYHPIRPVKESPNIAGGKATSLKCPPATPHLMVVENGKEKPIINPVFKCEYYGGEPVWTVNSTDQLTNEGPPVYCTEKHICVAWFFFNAVFILRILMRMKSWYRYSSILLMAICSPASAAPMIREATVPTVTTTTLLVLGGIILTTIILILFFLFIIWCWCKTKPPARLGAGGSGCGRGRCKNHMNIACSDKGHRACYECFVDAELADRTTLKCERNSCNGVYPIQQLMQVPALAPHMQQKLDHYAQLVQMLCTHLHETPTATTDFEILKYRGTIPQTTDGGRRANLIYVLCDAPRKHAFDADLIIKRAADLRETSPGLIGCASRGCCGVLRKREVAAMGLAHPPIVGFIASL